MKSVKAWIYSIIYLVLCFTLCKTCISDYREGADKKKVGYYEKMIADNSVVTAELSSTYKETTIKIARIPVKTYEFDYSFYLAGEPYTGKITLSKLPESRFIKLYYLRENPKIISQNPGSDLKREKEKGTSKANLYWGILFGVLGLLILLGIIGRLLKSPGEKGTKTPKMAKPQKVEVKPVEEKPVEEKVEEPKIDKEDHSRFMPK
jgi:hypothetical protein